MARTETTDFSEPDQLAKFIGLPKWQDVDDFSLVEHIRNGFPVSTVFVVVERIDPDGRFLKVSDVIPKSTLHRRKNQTLTKDESEKVWALARVLAEVLRLYHGDREKAALFLSRGHPLMRGRSPIQLATESTAGADLVLQFLGRAEAGVAA